MIPAIQPRGHAVLSFAVSGISVPPGSLQEDESGVYIIECASYNLPESWRLWSTDYYSSRRTAEAEKVKNTDNYLKLLIFRVVKLDPHE